MRMVKELKREIKALKVQQEKADRTSEIHHELFERAVRESSNCRTKRMELQAIVDKLSPPKTFPLQGKRNRSS